MSSGSLATPAGLAGLPTPQTVLVVDDEPTARIALAARLKRLGYRVIEAVDGKSGLDALRRERPDLTILDWMMPEIDGPSFCERVRQDPELLTSQILMMTSHDEPEQIAEGLARGADDFLSKAASKYEITARVQSGVRAATLIRRLEDATEEIRRKQEVLEREIQSAASYVESLLPAPGIVAPGVQMVHAYRPSLGLGGDLFNIVSWGDGVLGLYLLDASGHGVSSALRSAALSTFLRRGNLLRHVGSTDPGAILTEANKQFPLTEDGNYFTIIFARLDIRARTLSYATAGHNGAFLQRSSGEFNWMARPNLPLGFDASTTYVTTDLTIAPGDRLYLLSDGLYEVPDSSGALWGQDRLEETICGCGPRPLTEVVARSIEEAIRWQGHEQFPDDVALMGVEVTAAVV
ncbi:MAG: SpoIIE family protein phosphatase [Nitrospira sp.]|nr:SpoIIE family protein phosphatase [Nitrospira sp.]MDH5347218.1 SpoIIE family protein phosphatase [Nitrospira sp.]MDH5498593.1 SpoIIE family protein phosphatase [Nitrospira sp.]